ncbi:MAG: YjbQ family protein [Acidobacteria bacterium]|nr:YjbQ family protein [Acidobacteriota bacterium]
MKVFSSDIKWETSASSELDCRDLTAEVRARIRESGIRDGIVNVFVPGSTGSIVSIEAEEGLFQDLRGIVKRLVDGNAAYEHQRRWQDNNSHSHLRATLLGASLTVPLRNGDLAIGAWQQIVFVEFDVKHPRKRTVLLQVLGISSAE